MKKYIVARYWRGSYVETVTKPCTKKEAENICDKLNKSSGELSEYKVLNYKSKQYHEEV